MSKKIKKIISSILYYSIAYYLPKSHIRLNFIGFEIKMNIFKYIRQTLSKNILEYMGENVNIERKARINSKIKIGDNSSLGIEAIVQGYVTIGKNVMMGPECLIYTINHKTDRVDIPMIEQGMTNPKPVIIEDDVWIGRRVIILPGVNIGEGSIIGAGTVVTKNVEPYSICVGNPGRIVKNRKKFEGEKNLEAEENL